MVSDKFNFGSYNTAEAARIPLKVEKFAKFGGLSPTNSRLLSLLSEEVISMVGNILPKYDAVMVVKNEKNKYEIETEVSATVTAKEKDSLLALSNGKNAATGGGLLGKIGNMFLDWAIELNEHPELTAAPYIGAEMSAGMMSGAGYWSMRQYLETKQDKAAKNHEEDGLERSIIVNIADDCQMGVRSGSVSIIVTKSFEEKGFDMSV
jgi:hypothetical protein